MSKILYADPKTNTNHLQNYFSKTRVGALDILSERLNRSLYDSPVSSIVDIAGYLGRDISGGKILTPDQYRESEYYREGLEVPTEGIREGAANILAEEHDLRFQRNLVLSRAPDSIPLAVAGFGVDIFGSMLDPINIGLSLVPGFVVGKSAAMAARVAATRTALRGQVGRTGERFLTGAASGVVGTAAVEPVIFAAQQIRQDPDYGLYDSFINLVAGGILGGGIHAIGGKIGDAFTNLKKKELNEFYRVSVAQAVTGERIEVSSLTKAIPALNQKLPNRVFPKDPEQPGAGVKPEPVVKARANSLPPSLRPVKKKPKSLSQFIVDEGGVSTKDANAGDVKSTYDAAGFGILRTNGKSLDELALSAQEAGYFQDRIDSYDDRPTISELLDLMRDDVYSGRKVFSGKDPYVNQYNDAVELYEQAAFYDIEPTGKTDEEFFAEINEKRALYEQDEADFSKGPTITQQEIDDEISRIQQISSEQGDLEEFVSAREQMEQDAADFADPDLVYLTEENRILEEQLQYNINRNLVADDFIKDLEELDRLAEKADVFEVAAKAGAFCVARQP